MVSAEWQTTPVNWFFEGMSEEKRTGILLIGVGTMLTSMAVAGFGLGFFVDYWLDSQPVFMLIFGGLGLVGGIIKVHKVLSSLG